MKLYVFWARPGLALLKTCRVSWKIWEISASSWFYYKEICYNARSEERKIIPLL